MPYESRDVRYGACGYRGGGNVRQVGTGPDYRGGRNVRQVGTGPDHSVCVIRYGVPSLRPVPKMVHHHRSAKSVLFTKVLKIVHHHRCAKSVLFTSAKNGSPSSLCQKCVIHQSAKSASCSPLPQMCVHLLLIEQQWKFNKQNKQKTHQQTKTG